MNTREYFVQCFKGEKPKFVRVLEAIPGDKASYTPHPRSMTAADIAALLAQNDPRRECPEVGILSNVKADGSYIGIPNAGQDWHTDMSYRDMRGFVNVLYGLTIPRRDGKILGGTEFSSMHAVYRALLLAPFFLARLASWPLMSADETKGLRPRGCGY